MLGAFTKLFDSNDREIKKLSPAVAQIQEFGEVYKKLKDSDFPKKTEEFKKRVQEDGESVFTVLPEAFALVREAAHRSIGLRHFDVQLMSAIVLSQGKISEQKTGEGKTLSAVPALYLHALTGKSVHLVTVNDYLARRDAGWMGDVFAFLGMSVSSIISGQAFLYDKEYEDANASDYRLLHLKPTSRAEAYKADIVYGINSEFGFDYLRDNMSQNKDDLVQRGHYYAVIDEVDSVLIDEARTPHIISMPDATPSQKYVEYAKVVENLKSSTDFVIDEKMRTAHLTEHGLAKLEKMYGITDIYEKDFDTVFHVEAALKAKTLFADNKDYIVRDNQVILVDEFTGRLLEGRRLSEGLHQAIEAKEGVPIQQESKTLATVSLQNYFRMYTRLAGMTGTAATEAEEFYKIYGLEVVTIPTHRTNQREDESDQIYKTIRAKVAAVVAEVEEAHKKGQPVLVGTTSIDKNEIISEYLKRKKIPHEVLNAKNHVREALIIRDAGRLGAVTVATNMAGRGVDIILGGQPPSQFEREYQSESGKKKFEQEQAAWQKEHDQVVEAGGLYVIGTEKHESRRIDNQLRGRSARQGDPGRSMFIISLEDDLMRVFGGDSIAGLMTKFNFPEDQPLTHPLVTRVITQAQIKVEGFNFENRKHVLEYDDVLNKQREIIYTMRRKLLEDDTDSDELVMAKVESEITRIVTTNLELLPQDEAHKKIREDFVAMIPFDEHSQKHLAEEIEKRQEGNEIIEFMTKIAADLQKKRVEQFGDETMKTLSKLISLNVIDNLWMQHLTSIEDLRTGIGLRGYAQRDPLVEYKNEAFSMFESLMRNIDDGVVSRFFRVNPIQAPPPTEVPEEKMITNQPESEVSANAIRKVVKPASKISSEKKLSRNDPCWCGSGKKWKKCHYPNVSA
jgi:preprotein translocase subunit SecA